MDDFSGKVAVITGAGSGIGLATAHLLGRQGAKVVLADRDEARLAAAAISFRDGRIEATTAVADVSRFADNQHVADVAYDAYGTVDILFLNAGVGIRASLLDDDPANWETVVGVNLLGVVWGIKAFAPRMVAADRPGVILATSSGAGAEGTSYYSPAYAATKNGVVSVMEALHGQLRDRQSVLRAGIVFPPLTATHLNGGPELMKGVESYLQSTGVPAVLVEPEAVARMVLDGIARERFYIRAGTAEGEKIFDGAITEEFQDWNEQIIRGRAEAQISDGTPDAHLW